MLQLLAVLLTYVVICGCDSNQRTPTPPPAPDIALPSETDAAAATDAADPDTGPTISPDELRPPIADNLLEFVPEVLDGVKARRRQAIKSAPIVHGFYQGEKRKIYNLHLTGPTESEATRRAEYPMLGSTETQTDGPITKVGFKVEGFDGQQTYNSAKKKSEAVVLPNPYVEVKLSVAPTDDADAATKLIEQLDLKGISKLR